MCMSSTGKKSWLPTRSGGASLKRDGEREAVTRDEKEGRFASTKGDGARSSKGSVSANIRLPNGDTITTVRRDVMDQALGRGEYKKK